MKKGLVLILLLVLASAGAWYLSQQYDKAGHESTLALDPVTREAPAPVARHPIEPIPVPETTAAPVEEPEPEPLPALAASDPIMASEVSALVGEDVFSQYLLRDHLVPRLVATIDSLTSAQVAPLSLPIKPIAGKFQVLDADGEFATSAQNAERYTALVDFATQVDTEQAVALYREYYPWFQQAYVELGYPEGYFNDRLIEVIDHLLATPDPQGPLDLVRNEAVFEFEDERLESLSAGQKALLRMGQDNRQRVKQRLSGLREVLATGN